MANRQCPACSSEKVHRSHRRGVLERFVLALLRIRPYRCFECNRRFYSLVQDSAEAAPPDPPAQLEGEEKAPSPVRPLAGSPPAGRSRTSRQLPERARPAPAPGIIFRNRCADCGSRRVHPSSPRTPIERLLIILLSRPYRCEDCNARLVGPYLQFGRRVTVRGRQES